MIRFNNKSIESVRKDIIPRTFKMCLNFELLDQTTYNVILLIYPQLYDALRDIMWYNVWVDVLLHRYNKW
jgi:hypothetical protein